MTTNTLIYKYPILKSLFETKCNNKPINLYTTCIYPEKYQAIPNYLNPHSNILKCYERDNNYKYYLSKHPSNDAIKIMMENPSFVNLDGLIRNTNPKIGPLLKRSFHQFKDLQWLWMSRYCISPTVMEFLEKHLDKICWHGLSKNSCNDAIRILEKNQNKIIWVYFSANPSGMEIIKKNLDKIHWHKLCENTNPEAISIIEQNLDKIDYYILSSNPSAISILSQNLDKIHVEQFSMNPNAMDILINHPNLIDDYNFVMLYSYDISCLEKIIKNNQLHQLHYLIQNPNSFPLIEKMLKQGLIPEKIISSIHKTLVLNSSLESLFDLDYQEMSKVRSNLLYDELIRKAFHPSRVAKLLDYHCDNGGNVTDFEM